MGGEHLVVDTGAFLRLKQLDKFEYSNVHVVPAVAAEIRDEAARRNLDFALTIPQITAPSEKDMQHVEKFARETGDAGFLSFADLQIIALTYALQKETGNVENLKQKPHTTLAIEVEDEDKWSYHSDDSDGEKNWIGEENLEEHMEGHLTKIQDNAPAVACLTTDYSVQNVLMHMGLSVVSIDGYRIERTKKWALVCRACKETFLDTTRLFCKKCGNHGLRRVPVIIKADGTAEVQLPVKPFINLRGTIYPIPKPKGGRKGDLIFCEDQFLIGGRDRLLRRQQKLLLKEKAEHNPFNPDIAFEQRGWWTAPSTIRTSAMPKIGLGPGNPNSNRWRKRHAK